VKTKPKTKKKTEKPFDSIESKRKAQSRIYRRIKNLTPRQEAAFFDKAIKTGPFASMWKDLVTKGRKARSTGKLTSSARRTA
jgi:hypothetical protein